MAGEETMKKTNPRLFMDISFCGAPSERIVIELYGQPRIFEHSAQGGDFENFNGTGGETIYGKTFPAETNPMDVDDYGVLTTVNPRPGATGSLFAIRFLTSDYARNNAVFGKVFGMMTLSMLKQLDRNSLVKITHCGQLPDDPEIERLSFVRAVDNFLSKHGLQPLDSQPQGNAFCISPDGRFFFASSYDTSCSREVNLVEMPESLESNAEISQDLQPQECLDSDSDLRSEQLKKSKPVNNQDQEKEYQSFQSVQTNGPVKAQVHKQGFALGRSVDLTKFNNYNELISELDELFEFNGELKNGNKNWLVVYTDDEGDMMLVGDDPWQEFCGLVRRMFIYTREEVHRMKPGT